MKALAVSDLSIAPEALSRDARRQRIIAVAASVALACSGATSCTRTQVGLSTAAIAAVVVGTTVGVTYAVKHHRHTLEGCVFSDANGFKLRTSEAKVYTIKGDAAEIHVGDNVKFHGSKAKKMKGDSRADRVFVVDKLSKDYGPCAANVAAPTARTR